MKFILVDATSYVKKMDSRLYELKQDYFLIKNYVRNIIIGDHQKPQTKTYGLGLLRIATILNENGHSVKYIHLDEFETNVFTIIKDFNPDIVAFSAVCPTINICSKIASEIKRINSKLLLCIGGAHINVATEITQKNYPIFDIYNNNYDLEACAVLLKQNKSELVIPKRYVDYSLLPYDINMYTVNTFSTLGCRYSCKYCQDNLAPYFENEMDGQISYLKGVLREKTCIHFFDSILGYNNLRAQKVCEALEKTGHNFKLSCDMRSESITPEFIEKLQKAGFVELRIGLESGSEDVLANNRRTYPLNKMIEVFELIKKYSDMYLSVYCLSGLLGSNRKSIIDTRHVVHDLLKSKVVDEVKNGIYVPYPMDGRDYSFEGIYIDDKNWENYDRQSFPVYHLNKLSREEIWMDFIELTSVINTSWMEAYHIKDLKNLPQEIYPEYNLFRYSKENG